MKISNSKKELARIISENGGWNEGCDFAVQDRDSWVCSYEGRPTRLGDAWKDNGDCLYKFGFQCDTLLPNWHQTILSREEYFHLYPATDADGWIEWNGKPTSPVMHEIPVDLKLRNGRIEKCQSIKYDDTWGHDGGGLDIIAYRLHKPEQAEPEFCESVMRSIPEHSEKPTIEQLAADYRNAKDYADRKQQEADEAKADAEAKLAELVAAGKELGLVLSVVAPESELVITDWRDLKVGDIIQCVGSWEEEKTDGMQLPVTALEGPHYNGDLPIRVDVPGISCPDTWGINFKFIRRP